MDTSVVIYITNQNIFISIDIKQLFCPVEQYCYTDCGMIAGDMFERMRAATVWHMRLRYMHTCARGLCPRCGEILCYRR